MLRIIKDKSEQAPPPGTSQLDAGSANGAEEGHFDTEFTQAFTERFLDGDDGWPANNRNSAARLRDLNTFTRLLLSGAQIGKFDTVVVDSGMDAALFNKVKEFLENFTLDGVKGWPQTAVERADKEPWRSLDIDFRSLRMAEASVLISRLIAASAIDPPGGGDDKVKYPLKPV